MDLIPVRCGDLIIGRLEPLHASAYPLFVCRLAIILTHLNHLAHQPEDVLWMFPDYPLTLAGRDVPRGTYLYDHKESWWAEPSFYVLIGVAALASAATRAAFSRLVVAPLARRVGVEKSAQRLEESLMQVLFYSFAWIFNTIFLVKQDWFWYPIITFLDSFPNQHVDTEIWWFYGIQTGWYVYCLYAHLYQDSRKSDYWIMIVHHVVTLALLYAAFVTGYFRVGMLVMFSMDVCDIFVFSAKSLKILDKDGRVPKALYFAAYATLPTVWVAFRLIYFPYVVLHTTMVGTIKIFSWANIKGWIPYNVLLSILFVLNVFWFYQIARIGLISMRKGNARAMDDIREIQEPAVTTEALIKPSMTKRQHPATKKRAVRKGKAKVAL